MNENTENNVNKNDGSEMVLNRRERRKNASLERRGLSPTEHHQKTPIISQGQFKETLIPKIDDFVEGFPVVYRNIGQLRFTAEVEDGTIPEIGTELIFVGKRYIVEYINKERGRFSAKFVGFKEYEQTDLPVDQVDAPNEKEEITKVL